MLVGFVFVSELGQAVTGNGHQMGQVPNSVHNRAKGPQFKSSACPHFGFVTGVRLVGGGSVRGWVWGSVFRGVGVVVPGFMARLMGPCVLSAGCGG